METLPIVVQVRGRFRKTPPATTRQQLSIGAVLGLFECEGGKECDPSGFPRMVYELFARL